MNEDEVSLPRKVKVLAQRGSETSKGHDATLRPPSVTARMRPNVTLQPPPAALVPRDRGGRADGGTLSPLLRLSRHAIGAAA